MIRIRIDYFAGLREQANRSTESLETAATTAGEVYDELKTRYPFPDRDRIRVAVNDEFGDWNQSLADGDVLVFIPPVAGG